MLEVRRYTSEMRAVWDEFVGASKNGTFLVRRDYVEHHAERFHDHSLIVTVDDDVIALLPAHRQDDEICSHHGLTYGGLIISPRMTMRLMRETFAAVLRHVGEAGARALVYKTVPHIYHRQPAEEDRDLLYRHGAELTRRNMFTVVDMQERPPLQQRRKRGVKAACRAGLSIEEGASWGAFWDVLSVRLAATYNARPVHTLDEIECLHRSFPGNIRLFTVNEGSRVVGGTVVYETERVARLQYIAASDRGQEVCGLDLLFDHLLEKVFTQKRFVDFGSSNDASDVDINFGVIEFKEGFGGRPVAHDWYRMRLDMPLCDAPQTSSRH